MKQKVQEIEVNLARIRARPVDACQVCGRDVRAGVKLCRVCDATSKARERGRRYRARIKETAR
jgi:hypothetical protein